MLKRQAIGAQQAMGRNDMRSVAFGVQGHQGTTLVELVTVVAMVAILAMIAYPSYLQYLQRARRTEATAALVRIAANQERFYLQNRTYTTSLAQVGFPGGQTESGYYLISIPLANAADYQVMATAAPGTSQSEDADCQQFSIDDQSVRFAAPDPDGQCW